MNDHPGQFLAAAYPRAGWSRFTRILVSIDTQYLNDARRRLVSGDRSALGPTLVQTIVHGHLDADKSPHQALLIDAVLYLASPACGDVPPTLRERARERAANAEEWLLFPCDPMPDGVGVSARFVPNKHISADMFLRLNEPEGSERDPAP